MIESRHFLLNYGFNPVSSNTVQTDDEFNVYPLSRGATLRLSFLIFRSSFIYSFMRLSRHSLISGPGPRESGAPSSWSSGCRPDPKQWRPRGQEPLLMNKNATEGSWQRQGLPTRWLK